MSKERQPKVENEVSPIRDWKVIFEHLQAAQTRLEQAWKQTPQQKREILKTRAKTLARSSTSTEDKADTLPLLEFSLAYERYAIVLDYVREVYPLRELTPIPGTPAFVLGVVSVRGRIVSVVDLKNFFDLPDKGLTDLNKIIIAHSSEMEIGILADAISGIHLVPRSEIQASLPTLTGIRGDYLKGVTSDRIVVLDAQKLLSDPRIIVQQEAEPAG